MTTIKDAPIVELLIGTEKFPISDGSGKPVTATIQLIIDKVPEPDLSEYATKEEIPTKVSQLENDSNYLIDNGVDNGVYVLTTDNKIIDYKNINNDLVLGVVLINDSYKMLIDLYEGKNGRTRTFTLSNAVNLPNIDYDTADGSNIEYYISDFSNFNSLTQGAISDKDGSVNSETLKLLEGDSSSVCGFLRDIAEYDQSDWIVPSCGLLALIYLYKEEINQILDYVGGDLYDNDFYWTCTEKDSESAWCINFTNGLVTSTPKTTKKCRIRAIYNLNVLKPIKTTLTNLETKVTKLENKDIPEATIETVGGVKKFEIMDLQDKSNIDNLYKAYNTLVEQMVNAGVAEDTRFVDLGLPSGTLWATCNLGSDSIDDPGLFFLWGDIEGYYYKDGLILDLYGEISDKRFKYNQYKWFDGTDAYENGNHEGLIKYLMERDDSGSIIAVQTSLLPEDNAAINYKSNLNIPTANNVSELLKNTNKTYVEMNGRTMLCCESINNGNKLYFPKVGYIDDSQIESENVYFWPSYINFSNLATCLVLNINPDGPSDQGSFSLINRYCGLPIRPVKKV